MLLPLALETIDQLPLAPALGVEDLVPKLMQAGAIAVIEADAELREVGRQPAFQLR